MGSGWRAWLEWLVPLLILPVFWAFWTIARDLVMNGQSRSEAAWLGLVLGTMFLLGLLVPRAWVAAAILPLTSFWPPVPPFYGRECANGGGCEAPPDFVFEYTPLPYVLAAFLAALFLLLGSALRTAALVLVYARWPNSFARRFVGRHRSG